MTITALTEALYNGLSYSSILILIALGLAITFGVMRVINMAHGDMLMLGAYAAYVVEDRHAIPILVNNLGLLLGRDLHTDFGLNLNLFCAIPIAFVTVGLFGYLMEVTLIRRLYGRPLDTLLATWGVGLVLQQAVSSAFGPELKPTNLPESLRGNWRWEAENVTFTHYRLFIIAFTCLCLLGVYVWFYRTRFGLEIRAVTQDRAMASALGISTRRIDSLTFAFGTGLAGVAGCIVAHLHKGSSDMGNDYVIDAFMVVILGGMGSLLGTIAGGTLIGTGQSVVQKIISTSAPTMLREVDGPMSKVAILLVVIAFIMLRPSGLLATKERVYD